MNPELQAGDPTVFGWLVTVGYIALVFPCVLSARRADSALSVRTFWAGLALLLLALGLNKQLDFQIYLVEWGKAWGRENGLRQQRALLYKAAATGALLFIVISALALRKIAQTAGRSERWALFGLLLLCLFVGVRSVTFSLANLFTQVEVLGNIMGATLEFSALACLAFAVKLRLGRTAVR